MAEANYEQSMYNDTNWLSSGLNITYSKNNDYYLGKSRKGLPEIKGKKNSWKWILIFLALSVIVGILTEGLGSAVFAGLLAGTGISEGTALVVAGVVQTIFEVGGQAVINVLAGHTDKISWIMTIMPGLGVMGLGKVFKGLRLIKNENLMFKSMIKQGIDVNTAKELTKFTSLYVGGKTMEENLFLHAIDEGNVKVVRSFREKIYRSSGIGVQKKFKNWYKAQSTRYGHETIEDIPSLIEQRLSGQYDLKWKFKANKERLTKLYGEKWVKNQEKKDNLDWILNGLDDFKAKQLKAKEGWFNRKINRPITTIKRKKVEVNTAEEIGIKFDYFNPQTGQWKSKSYLYNDLKTGEVINPSKFSEYTSSKIYATKQVKRFVKETPADRIARGLEPERLLDYGFKIAKHITNPLRLIKPTNLIRKGTTKIAKIIEKLALKLKWFDRLIKQIKKGTKYLNKIDSTIVKRLNLIPAINSQWQIGFRILNSIGTIRVEIFYWNKAKMKVIQVQRELNPLQFERMLVAYESGKAGEFYNSELALGWGLKKEWTNLVGLTTSIKALKIQRYLYSSIWVYRNIKSGIKGIKSWKEHKYQDYDWKQNLKDYSLLRLIRSSGQILGLGFISSGLGVSLYRGKDWSYGLTSSFARRTRTSIKRWKRKPYYNPRIRKYKYRRK